MDSPSEKKPREIQDYEKHGAQDASMGDTRRGSVTGRLRGSLSVQHVPEDKIIEGQVFSMNAVDPVLDAKMRILNEV